MNAPILRQEPSIKASQREALPRAGIQTVLGGVSFETTDSSGQKGQAILIQRGDKLIAEFNTSLMNSTFSISVKNDGAMEFSSGGVKYPLDGVKVDSNTASQLKAGISLVDGSTIKPLEILQGILTSLGYKDIVSATPSKLTEADVLAKIQNQESKQPQKEIAPPRNGSISFDVNYSSSGALSNRGRITIFQKEDKIYIGLWRNSQSKNPSDMFEVHISNEGKFSLVGSNNISINIDNISLSGISAEELKKSGSIINSSDPASRNNAIRLIEGTFDSLGIFNRVYNGGNIVSTQNMTLVDDRKSWPITTLPKENISPDKSPIVSNPDPAQDAQREYWNRVLQTDRWKPIQEHAPRTEEDRELLRSMQDVRSGFNRSLKLLHDYQLRHPNCLDRIDCHKISEDTVVQRMLRFAAEGKVPSLVTDREKFQAVARRLNGAFERAETEENLRQNRGVIMRAGVPSSPNLPPTGKKYIESDPSFKTYGQDSGLPRRDFQAERREAVAQKLYDLALNKFEKLRSVQKKTKSDWSSDPGDEYLIPAAKKLSELVSSGCGSPELEKRAVALVRFFKKGVLSNEALTPDNSRLYHTLLATTQSLIDAIGFQKSN